MNAQVFPDVDEAQQGRLKLSVLLDQALDAMPANTDPTQRAAVAGTLVGETLASAVRRGLLPVRTHAGTLMACRGALSEVPAQETLSAFQSAAKSALRTVITPGG